MVPAARAIAPAIAPADDPRGAGVVRLAGRRTQRQRHLRARRSGAPPHGADGDGASVVDVLTVDGARVLGLVARADPVRDLALVQVARPGPPVMLHDGPPLSSGSR